MEQPTLIKAINSSMDIQLPEDTTFSKLRYLLQQNVKQLIENDFQKLVDVLYRVDVNEGKLKFLLQENVGEDTPVIIADLIIERQMEKIRTRAAYKPRNEESDEEKW